MLTAVMMLGKAVGVNSVELCPTRILLRGGPSPIERIRVSLETTGLLRFFEARLFSGSDVNRGKPAPDLFLRAAERTGVSPPPPPPA